MAIGMFVDVQFKSFGMAGYKMSDFWRVHINKPVKKVGSQCVVVCGLRILCKQALAA